MSTIKINELATSGISLTDFFVKANENGVATKNTILNLANILNTSGDLSFKGKLMIADTPVEGWYFAGESGTYTNAGSLVVSLSGNLVLIIVPSDPASSEKLDVLLSITIDNNPEDGSTNAVSSGGVYDALQDKPNLVPSTNKFDKDNAVIGYFMQETGSISANATYDYSPNIPVEEAQVYVSTHNMRFTTFFDSNDVVVSGGSSGDTKSITIPSGVAYIVVTIYHTDIDDFQLELGTVSTAYQPYKKVIESSQLEVRPENIKEPLTALNLGEANYFNKNLFNKDSSLIDVGTFINSSGDHSSNATYDTTGIIELPDNTTEIILSYSHNIAFRDANNAFISFISDGGNENVVKEVPSNAKYVDCTILTGTENDFVVLVGSKMTTDFKAYADTQQIIEDLVIEKKDVIASDVSDFVCLPKEVPVAVGRTIEIYHRNVSFYSEDEGYYFLWTGIGKSMKRKWSYTGVSDDIGDTTLTLEIFNSKNKRVFKGTTTVKVANSTIISSTDLTAIGDSLTNDKAWIGEIRTLSSDQINFVGTRGATSNKHEGRSGIKAIEMLGEFNYTGDTNGITGNDGKAQNTNPFWKVASADIDFDYYKSNYSLNPDILVIFLGTNGIAVNPDVNAGAIKTFIDKIRSTGGSSTDIYVVHTLYRGSQDSIANQASTDGYEASTNAKVEEDLKVFNLHKNFEHKVLS